jgi:uncharacterized membrane protein YkoI
MGQPVPLILAAALLAAPTFAAEKPPRVRVLTVRSAKEAKAIAERETGGTAVSAKKIPLNGATGGWEVEVRMPDEDRGWRCIVDCDTRAVRTKDRIPNPQRGKQK